MALVSQSFMIAFLMSVGQVAYVYQQNLDCGTIHFQEHVTNISLYKYRLDIPATAQLLVNYNITFKQDKCCPILSFVTDSTLYANSHRDDTRQCFKKNIENIFIFSKYYIRLASFNYKDGCKKQGEYCICSGMRKFHIGYRDRWWIFIANKCGYEEQQLDLQMNMDFQCTYPMTCEELSMGSCRSRLNYNQTIFPNTLGFSSQRLANFFYEGITSSFGKVDVQCYKYMWDFICYSFYPKCQDDKHFIPCRQTCEDCVAGCHEILDKFDQPLYCGSYPSMSENGGCFYEPVTCPKLKPPRFGQLRASGNRPLNESKYICDKGYELNGNSVRHCMYMGIWNGSEPVCVQTHSSYLLKVLLPVCLVLTCVLIIIFVLCIRFRRHVSLLFAYNGLLRKNFYKVQRQKFKLFLTYSSLDRDRVEKDLLPKMKLELYDWGILTYQEDFLGGDSIIESIDKAIKESKAAVVLLTQNYIESNWC